MEILRGLGLLFITLGLFSVFSLKAPKGQSAMSGLANAAIATFLIEAILKYIAGDFFNIQFFGETGSISGSMGGVAAAALTMLQMGVSPVLAITAGVAVGGFGILPGFIAGYFLGLIAPSIEANVIAVMLEPLTQADIVTKNAIPIYVSDFMGGALAGLSSAYFGIINNAPGTASPIPGLLAPFAFNPPMTVLVAMIFAAIGGIIAGIIGGFIFKDRKKLEVVL